MDYTKARLLFRISKVARYLRLYGFRRTWAKVRSQYHKKKTYAVLPPLPAEPEKSRHIGVIGCGNFSFGNIAYYLRKNYGKVIHGAMDPHIARAASLFEHYDLNYYTDDADRILADPQIDLVFIASNHASHAEYAIRALELGKSVHIEKPHVVSRDQLVRLVAAMEHSSGKVNLGFNRPMSPFGKLIKHHLDSQTGAAMYNWFIAGHEIEPDHWYFRQEEGGRVLGNLCHWTDFTYQLVVPEGRYPITIRPTRAEKSDCDIVVNYVFGDGSIATISFSAKGHTFEGVRERFAAHRGNVLLSMDDFQKLTIEIVDQKIRRTSLYREHGHEAAIRRSYELVRPVQGSLGGVTPQYVWETGELFLATRDALEQNRETTIYGFGSRSAPPLAVAAQESL